MFPVIQILGLTLPVGPLAKLLAFWVGSDLGARALGGARHTERRPAWQAAFNNATIASFFVGLVGARLWYAARYYWLYLERPGLLLSVRPGTLALVPGLFIGVAVGIFLLRRAEIPWAQIADAVAVATAGAFVVLSLGNFGTGAAYGVPTSLPWGVELWGAVRHPVHLYSAVAYGLVLLALWRLLHKASPGEVSWYFVLGYSLSQLILAAFRANAAVWGPGIRVTQVVALAMLLVSMYVLSFYAQRRELAASAG